MSGRKEGGEIYGLCHPVTGELRYIGKANNSEKRLATHIRDMRRRDTPVYRWMRKLASNGMKPKLCVLEVAEDWREAEVRLIEQSRASGARLLNVASGGDQPHCTPEQRRRGGVLLNEFLRNNPLALKIRELKKHIGADIRAGRVNNYRRLQLRSGACVAPEIYGSYAALPFLPQEGTHGRRY